MKNTRNPNWEFSTKLDLRNGSKVEVHVHDKDKFNKDDTYGNFEVDLHSTILNNV